MSCIYCGSKLEKIQENDGYNILECSNPKCNHNRTSCRMDKNYLRIVKSKLEKELFEIWVCPTFFRKSLTELGIGEYFIKDSRFSENIILRAIELFFKYPWANHNDVVKMLQMKE